MDNHGHQLLSLGFATTNDVHLSSSSHNLSFNCQVKLTYARTQNKAIPRVKLGINISSLVDVNPALIFRIAMKINTVDVNTAASIE